jgi:hypothetical protein
MEALREKAIFPPFRALRVVLFFLIWHRLFSERYFLYTTVYRF